MASEPGGMAYGRGGYDADGLVDRAELAGYFGPQSITWRVAGEAALLAGGGRAVLMQLAHPLVAAGVGQHSAWHQDPWRRTFETIELTSRIVFGTRSDARAAARSINRLHDGVTGMLPDPAGAFPAGAGYRAHDPELLLWVLATLVDTGLLLYPLLVAPLTAIEQEQYYHESTRTAGLLGLPARRMPRTLPAFHGYMDEMLAGDALAVTPPAREVARTVMHMPAPLALRPVLFGAEQITIGLLPPRLRAMYGFSWDRGRQALLELWAGGTRRILPLLPDVARRLPRARAAERRVRRGDLVHVA